MKKDKISRAAMEAAATRYGGKLPAKEKDLGKLAAALGGVLESKFPGVDEASKNKLSELFACAHCDATIPDVDVCPYCGANLGGDAAPETPAPVAAAEPSTPAEPAKRAGKAAGASRATKGPISLGEEAAAVQTKVGKALGKGVAVEERNAYVRFVDESSGVRFMTLWKRNGRADFFTVPAGTLTKKEYGDRLEIVSEETRLERHLGQMSHRYVGDVTAEVVSCAVAVLKAVRETAAESAAETAKEAEAKAAAKAAKVEKAAEKAAPKKVEKVAPKKAEKAAPKKAEKAAPKKAAGKKGKGGKK